MIGDTTLQIKRLYMAIVKEIFAADEKSDICNEVLRALPSWFGIEDAIVSYVEEVRSMPFFAVYIGDKAAGFVAIKPHGDYTAEIYVMGVLREYHGQGIGRSLINVCVEYCKKNKIEFLTVKTVDESRESKSYEKTRLFYQAMGFKKLETFPQLWDDGNPCMFMARHLDVNDCVIRLVNHFTATGFVFNSNGEILMIKHKKFGVWLPPGGHVDENELPCETVVREIFEETGVTAKVVTAAQDMGIPTDSCELPLPMQIKLEDIEGTGLHNHIDLIYLCRTDDSKLNPQVGEIDDIGWFTPAEIMKLDTFDDVRNSLQKAVRYIESGNRY
jgi:8-oxo-dGTP pyrophosphatase MutT (NUDIX family)/GNAT superfamily N-acetyltransferase